MSRRRAVWPLSQLSFDETQMDDWSVKGVIDIVALGQGETTTTAGAAEAAASLRMLGGRIGRRVAQRSRHRRRRGRKGHRRCGGLVSRFGRSAWSYQPPSHRRR